MIAEFQWKVRVYYEDTDAGGVVFYANYLRFMERARTEWLRQLGFEHKRLLQEFGVLFAVKNVTIAYKKSARLDEELNVTSRLLSYRGASINFQQNITNQQEELITEAEVRVVCLNAETMKPSPMPELLLSELVNVD
jgi:acyl-CoA thioester hydrolase